MDLPADTWIHFEAKAGLGEKATGTWDLLVRVKDKRARRFKDLSTGHSDWKKLHWLGFSSMADETVAFYLDNLELSNR